MSLDKILLEIADERQYQADKFANGDQNKLLQIDLENNLITDYLFYMDKYKVSWLNNQVVYAKDIRFKDFRKAMIKVAALAVAAVIHADEYLEEYGENDEDDQDYSYRCPTVCYGSLCE